MSNYKKLYDSTAPTERILFSIFVLGGEWRMGVLIRQDEALTVDQLLLIGDIYEKDRVKSNSEEEEKELESMITFATISF